MTIDSQFLVGYHQSIIDQLIQLNQNCKLNKIRNLKSNICVDINGKVGKQIIKDLIANQSFNSNPNINIWTGETILKGQLKDGKLNGNGKISKNNGDIYEGQFKDNQLNGDGKVSLINGNIIEGQFKNSKLNGNGKISYNNGDIYKGQFKDNQLNGDGKISYNNGNISEGQFKDNTLNGRGKISYNNGTIYEGQFKDNQLNGHGKISYNNGDIYEGQFKNSQLNGYGKISYVSGMIKIGQFKNNQLHGFGQTINGKKLSKGQFIEGKFSGTGYIKNEISNAWYEGDLVNMTMNGYATVVYPSGTIFKGRVKKNEIEFGQLIYINGDVYQGMCRNTRKSGIGKMTYINGIIYEGNFANNSIGGAGRATDIQGNIYIGNWDTIDSFDGLVLYQDHSMYMGNIKSWQREGQGQLILPIGKIFEGVWKHNHLKTYDQYLNLINIIRKKKKIQKRYVSLPKPKDWTEWQKLCYHSFNKPLTSSELSQLREFLTKTQLSTDIKIDLNKLTTRQLCVNLSHNYDLYQTQIKTQKQLKCQNDSTLEGDNFADLLQNEIIQDDHGYCFMIDEINKLTKHPYTNQPLNQILVKGIPITDYIKTMSTGSGTLHSFVSSSSQNQSMEAIQTDILVDLINSSDLHPSSTKYLNYGDVIKYETKSTQRLQILTDLKSQQLTSQYQLSLSTTDLSHAINYLDFLKILKNYVTEIPITNRETAKYVIIELFQKYP